MNHQGDKQDASRILITKLQVEHVCQSYRNHDQTMFERLYNLYKCGSLENTLYSIE